MSENKNGPEYLFEKTENIKQIKTRKLNRTKMILLGLLFVVFLAFILYFQSDLSKINYIDVLGNKYISTSKILECIDVKEGENKLFVSKRAIQLKLEAMELIESAKVNKTWNGTLEIIVTEKKVLACIIDDEVILILDNDEQIKIDSKDYNLLIQLPILNDIEDAATIAELKKIDEDILRNVVEIKNCPLSYDPDVICLSMNDGNFILVNRFCLDSINTYYDILKSLKSTRNCLYYDSLSQNAFTSACPWDYVAEEPEVFNEDNNKEEQ